MKRSPILRLVLLVSVVLLLLTVFRWIGGDRGRGSAEAPAGDRDRSVPGTSAGAPDAGPGLATKSGQEPRDPSAAQDAADWANRGGTVDGELPEVTRSQVRAAVPAGHSMVTGGHLLADGTREFAVITPKWIEMPSGSKMVEMEVGMLHFDAAGIAEAGLETLVTGDRKSEQNAEVWTPEEVARTMETVKGEAMQAKPKVVTTPGSPGRIQMGEGRELRFELELSATGATDGGFELTSDLKRVD
jgi:hypothetical protein